MLVMTKVTEIRTKGTIVLKIYKFQSHTSRYLFECVHTSLTDIQRYFENNYISTHIYTIKRYRYMPKNPRNVLQI